MPFGDCLVVTEVGESSSPSAFFVALLALLAMTQHDDRSGAFAGQNEATFQVSARDNKDSKQSHDFGKSPVLSAHVH